jgi:hypothetical protein
MSKSHTHYSSKGLTMGRPRKNPDDPKWQEPKPTTKDYDWQLFFAAALGGLIAKGGLSYDQLIKTASQIATEAQDSLS